MHLGSTADSGAVEATVILTVITALEKCCEPPAIHPVI